MIKVNLRGEEIREYENGTSIYDVAKSISEGLARVVMCGIVDGEVCDLRHKLDKDCTLFLETFDGEEGRKAFRHTTAHILAQAVKRLFPTAKLAIGPATAEGFYYDFDIDRAFTAEEIEKVEAEMKKIVKEGLEIETFTLPRNEAIELMEKDGETYKVELIQDLPEDEVITFYKQGDFVDLCRGPHLFNTKVVKAIKLQSENGSSGAYWKGDEKNKVLARIYGTSFTKAKDLTDYLEMRAEAIKRDHNKLGRQLGYFYSSDAIGQGLPLFGKNGAKVLQILQRTVEDIEYDRGYTLTKTPLMAKSDLYKISGHWDHYKDGMFVIGDEEKDKEIFALRPMTCPFQFSVYNQEQHSYRDLPIRYAETSTLFRSESSGEMHGLTRVRQFTISEGHLVCTKEQLREEFKGVVSLNKFFMELFGIQDDVKYRFSKWDPNNKEKYIGSAEDWEKTQNLMRELLDELELDYFEEEGEAAFYGPKLDIEQKNVYGKWDTAITVQIDFALAERFGMTFVNKNGEKEHPIIIHRTSMGCYERMLASLMEKYACAFPTWLSPTQVKILPLSDKYNDYTYKVMSEMKKKGIRVEADFRTEKIGYKIREARNERWPYIVVVGADEETNGTLSVRARKGEEFVESYEDFIARVVKETEDRVNNSGLAENKDNK